MLTAGKLGTLVDKRGNSEEPTAQPDEISAPTGIRHSNGTQIQSHQLPTTFLAALPPHQAPVLPDSTQRLGSLLAGLELSLGLLSGRTLAGSFPFEGLLLAPPLPSVLLEPFDGLSPDLC